MVQQTVVERLSAISRLRRPIYKIILSRLEGCLGGFFMRTQPPSRGAENLLHLGCGDQHFKGWVNADYYRFSDLIRKSRGLPDWMLDISEPWNCPDNYWDGIYTEHTLEHVDYPGAVIALSECLRTLKEGKWIRIVLPGLEQFLNLDTGGGSQAESIARLTQAYGHVSVWDENLLCSLLAELGYRKVQRAKFKQGCEAKLLKDLDSRRDESIYVEAQK